MNVFLHEKIEELRIAHNSNDSLTFIKEVEYLAISCDLLFCDKVIFKKTLLKLDGKILNMLLNSYVFSLTNKKGLFAKLLKKNIVAEVNFFIQNKEQIFVNTRNLLKDMEDNNILVSERRYLKIENTIIDYDNHKKREFHFKTVQAFKKWVTKYLPFDIENITVKKRGDNYIISSTRSVSIPFAPTTIRNTKIILNNIDFKHHRWAKKYTLINYKEKKMLYLESEIRKLKANI